MSGPRGGLVALSGEADPEDRSDDSEEALASARPTTGLVARVGLPRPLPRPAGPDSISCQLCILSCGANHCITMLTISISNCVRFTGVFANKKAWNPTWS